MRVRLRNYLLTGLLVILPLAVTYLVLNWLFTTLDNMLQPVLTPFFGRVRGLGILTGIAVILVAGAVASRAVGRRLIGFFEGLMMRVPVARRIYGVARQLSDRILVADENGMRGAFKRVVLLEWPRRGLYAIGFVTGGAGEESGDAVVHVFVPGTPNPAAGFTVLTTAREVQSLTLTVEEALQFVVAYGITHTPADVARRLAVPSIKEIAERRP